MWHERKADITRLLAEVQHPARSARRLVRQMLIYGDTCAVEMLTSPASRLLLSTYAVDLRGIHIQAVHFLAEQYDREGAPPIPSMQFVLAQDGSEGLHEMVALARLLVLTF